MIGIIAAIAYGIYFALQERAAQQREQAQIQTKADSLQLEQQALYAMMNPHFTFNALQSIQYFIMVQDKMSATKFLTQFAKLVRMNLDSSKSQFISLNDEIERLKLYLSLEKMRFQDKFDYALEVDEEIDKSETLIPPMILQPFVENSLKHGIMPLEGNGEISVHIQEEDENTLLVSIRDNGIGISASKKMKADRPNDHVSQGMTITQDRLKLFSKTTGKAYTIDFEEVEKEDGTIGGTLVRIRLPMKSRL
jgi:LytS/YehU family sensor histidine kinase